MGSNTVCVYHKLGEISSQDRWQLSLGGEVGRHGQELDVQYLMYILILHSPSWSRSVVGKGWKTSGDCVWYLEDCTVFSASSVS